MFYKSVICKVIWVLLLHITMGQLIRHKTNILSTICNDLRCSLMGFSDLDKSLDNTRYNSLERVISTRRASAQDFSVKYLRQTGMFNCSYCSNVAVSEAICWLLMIVERKDRQMDRQEHDFGCGV